MRPVLWSSENLLSSFCTDTSTLNHRAISEPDLISSSLKRADHPGFFPTLRQNLRMPVFPGAPEVSHLHEHDDGIRFFGGTKRADIDQAILLPHWQQLVKRCLKLSKVGHLLFDHHVIVHHLYPFQNISHVNTPTCKRLFTYKR